MFRRLMFSCLIGCIGAIAAMPSAAASAPLTTTLVKQDDPSVCANNVVPGVVDASYGAGFAVSAAMRRTKVDGDTMLTVTIVSPSGSDHDLSLLKQCVWADENENGSFDAGETMWYFAGTGSLANGTGRFSVTVPGVPRVCGRSWGAFDHEGGAAYKLSQISCLEAPPPAVLPEAGSVALLGVSAAAAAVAALSIRRRSLARIA